MSIEQRLAQARIDQARNRQSISHEDIELAVIHGRRLRAQAVRSAFTRLRPALSPTG